MHACAGVCALYIAFVLNLIHIIHDSADRSTGQHPHASAGSKHADQTHCACVGASSTCDVYQASIEHSAKKTRQTERKTLEDLSATFQPHMLHIRLPNRNVTSAQTRSVRWLAVLHSPKAENTWDNIQHRIAVLGAVPCTARCILDS